MHRNCNLTAYNYPFKLLRIRHKKKRPRGTKKLGYLFVHQPCYYPLETPLKKKPRLETSFVAQESSSLILSDPLVSLKESYSTLHQEEKTKIAK